MAVIVTAPVPVQSAGAVDRDDDVPMTLARGQPVPLRAVRRRGETVAAHGPASPLLGASVDVVEVGDGNGAVEVGEGDADRSAASAMSGDGASGHRGEATARAPATHALSFPAADAAGTAARHVCGPPMARTAAAPEASHALIKVDLVQTAGRGIAPATVASVFLHFRPLLFLAEKLHAQAVPAAAALGTAVADRDPDAALAILKSHLLAAAQLVAWPALARPNLALLASIDPVADADLDLAAAIDAKMTVPNVYCICGPGQATMPADRGNLHALAQNDNRARRDPAVIDWPTGLPSPSHESVANPRGTQPAIGRIPSGGRAALGSGAFARMPLASPMLHLPPTPPVDLVATSRRRGAAPRPATATSNLLTHSHAGVSAPIDTLQRVDALSMAQTLKRYHRTGALEFMLPSPLPSPTSSVSSSPVTATTARATARRKPTAVVPLPTRRVDESAPIHITELPSPVDAVDMTAAPLLCPCPDCARPDERVRRTRHNYGADDTLTHDGTATKRVALPCACSECANISPPPAKRQAVTHPAMTRVPVMHRDAPQVVLPSVSEWFGKRPLSPLLQPMPPPATTQQSTPCSVPECTEYGMRRYTSAMRPVRLDRSMGAMRPNAAANCPSDHHIMADRTAMIAPFPPPRWHAPHHRETAAESLVPLPTAARARYC
ncbi:hypothetical protein GGF31_003103 [Allomyces arbusculus]|nr:hypothetical protein GGF31_003103 [Allomyces arbusculus]